MEKMNFNRSNVGHGGEKERNGLQKDTTPASAYDYNPTTDYSNQSKEKTQSRPTSLESLEVKRRNDFILDLWIHCIKEMNERNVRILTLEKYYSDMDLMYEDMNQRIQLIT
ncbi:uncharacterized protein LOC134263158 [Saccostrea cucullata]|uniref:uncharacterized protein LOC134263158 n=1 Tax=Saccostrea cuccullata TaxID=36930 RepID=UPI002ED47B06